MNKENWIEVYNNPNYLVSSLGRLKRIKTQSIIKPYNNKNQDSVKLICEDNIKSHHVGKIVLLSFYPNETEKDYVGYKDGNIRNNCLSNLEWNYFNESLSNASIKEDFKDVIGFEEYYAISNYGRLYSKIKNRFIKGRQSKDKLDYYQVSLFDNKGSILRTYIHRLVTEHFIKNPHRLPVVNHKDGNKCNNFVENLEWTTYLGNNVHALETGLRPTKKVLEVNPNKEILRVFSSCVEASKVLGISKSSVTRCCQDKTPISDDTYIIFEEDFEKEITLLDGFKINKVIQYSIKGDYINSFNSVNEAHELTGVSISVIYKSCLGTIKSHRDFIWKYNKEEKNND